VVGFFRDRGFGTVVSTFKTLAILFENPKLQATDQRGLKLGNYLTQLSVSGLRPSGAAARVSWSN
jgi:hypothetical protein